jgi:hypothetical protein
MCVACYVDEAMKQKIIAYSAEFHQVTRSPYGKDDEIGMLNLIDAQSRSAILGRADPSKVFDLSVDNFIGMPGWFAAGDQPYQIWMTHTPAGEVVANSMGASLEANTLVGYSGDGISMYTHCGTISIRSTISAIAERSSTASATKSISAAGCGINAAQRNTRRFSRAACCWMSPPCMASRCCRQATPLARTISRPASSGRTSNSSPAMWCCSAPVR